MKIYVVFTGGTIGSNTDDGNNIIDVREGHMDMFLSEYRKKYNDYTEFATSCPYMILSENISSANLLSLISEINAIIDKGDAEGIIISHGTDTLSYSAAILSYVFSACRLPIVLVSANYIISDPRSNGLVNFRYAVRFIKEQHNAGVFVSYKNTYDTPAIHAGARIIRHQEFSDDITSANDTWYGKYIDDSYVANSLFLPYADKKSMFNNTDCIKLYPPAKKLIRIISYPEMIYPVLTPETMAVLHESYHSGTIAVNDEFIRFAESAKKYNIPIYLTGLSDEENIYASVDMYLKHGIIALPMRTGISQYCKLWLSVCNDLDILSVMKASFAGEFVN